VAFECSEYIDLCRCEGVGDHQTEENDDISSKQTMENRIEKDEDDYSIKFSLRCFKVPKILLMANADFTFGYIIKIDEKGRPRHVQVFFPSETIKTLIGEELDLEEIFSCIKIHWRFLGFDPGSAITVLLRWEHLKGFETMMIYSDKFSYVMRLSPTVYEGKK